MKCAKALAEIDRSTYMSGYGIGFQGKGRLPANSIFRDVMVTWAHEPEFLGPEYKARKRPF